jgi:ribA/ribD-fused uncharacterized protein
MQRSGGGGVAGEIDVISRGPLISTFRQRSILAVTMSRKESRFILIDDYTPKALLNFDGTEVVITPKLVLFWKPPSPFGQWTVSPFEVEGEIYLCAEQYMMAEKARLFGDFEIEQQIMNSDSPLRQQKLGKQVSGFTEERWAAERFNVVFRGNLAKFTQNEYFKALLLDTGDRRMVEASPIDRIWGIGLSANNPMAYDPKKWLGLNLLGKVLEDVRALLRDG